MLQHDYDVILCTVRLLETCCGSAASVSASVIYTDCICLCNNVTVTDRVESVEAKQLRCVHFLLSFAFSDAVAWWSNYTMSYIQRDCSLFRFSFVAGCVYSCRNIRIRFASNLHVFLSRSMFGIHLRTKITIYGKQSVFVCARGSRLCTRIHHAFVHNSVMAGPQ